MTPAQGEVWLMESPGTKARPALLVSRDEVIPVVTSVVVAPVTSTVREIPTCIKLGPEHGIDRDSVASFDNLRTIPKSMLTRRLGSIGPDSGHLICAALAALADC